MHYSTLLVALVAAAPFATADLHTRLQCIQVSGSSSSGNLKGSTEDAATIAACNAYKARNTGTNKWDTCPDCTVVQNNEVKACQSLAGHLGGDEFLYYCQQNGANEAAKRSLNVRGTVVPVLI